MQNNETYHGYSLEKAGKTLVAGGFAGCCAKTCVAPMDRVKILKQAHKHHYRDYGIFATHQQVVRLEGFQGLYRGNGAQMLRIFPYAAVQFLSFEYYSKILNSTDVNSNLQKFIAGSFAGFTAVSFTYPLDVIRARLAFQVKGEHVYLGIVDALRSIFSAEGGIRGLYRGIVPTIVGMAPYAGFSFYGFEVAKAFLLHHWPHVFGVIRAESPDRVSLVIPAKLLCGGLAGALAQTVSYPLDVARRRIQLSAMMADPSKYHSGFVRTLLVVYREDGVRNGLYRGLSINYLRVVPMVSVSFCTFETVKQLLGLDTSIRA